MADETTPVNGNGITKYKVEELLKTVSDLTKRVEQLEKGLIAIPIDRNKAIEETKSEICESVDDIKEDIKEIEIEMTKINSRLTIFQGAQAIFTTIAGVIASIVGRV